jgi:UDP:flavonoid glycosyltransferase YjiC (YdhE family)
VLVTLGSLGDLHPCAALASELKKRGHRVKIISTEFYRPRVEQLGIDFHPMRPDWDPTDSELIGQCENLRTGPEILFRQLILPHLQHTYRDLIEGARGADLMLAGELVYAAPLAAEKLGLRWASMILSPCSFFSAHDPSVLVNMPGLIRLRRAGWLVNRIALDLGRLATRHWWDPVRRLRREVGLRLSCDPLISDKFSPDLVLALFSRCFAQPQPDWPSHTVQAGFVYHDAEAAEKQSLPDIRDFLDRGEPPLVFTLGSTAVHHPGDFYRTSIEATKRLGTRAVLIGATATTQHITPEILSLPYVSYARIFPRASVIVHQGGSGTTGQALRAGRPMLFVPFGWDQPDNGARVERLGAALCLARSRYSIETAVSALRNLMNNERFAASSAAARSYIQSEDGVNTAADAAEKLLL